MKKEYLLLISFGLLLLFVNYGFIDGVLIGAFEDFECGVVERIVDGDTVEIQFTVNGLQSTEKLRLLGINSPEKGEVGSDEATEFLEREILGKDVLIYFNGAKFDRYGRKLGYIFLDGVNVNLKSVRLGFSNYYFPVGKTGYYSLFVSAWDECMREGTNLCQGPQLTVNGLQFTGEQCIEIERVSVLEQVVVLKNVCSWDVDISGWSVKDEGRKKFVFGKKVLGPYEEVVLGSEDFGKDYVWTKTGDSVFVRNAEGELVIFYGY